MRLEGDTERRCRGQKRKVPTAERRRGVTWRHGVARLDKDTMLFMCENGLKRQE